MTYLKPVPVASRSSVIKEKHKCNNPAIFDPEARNVSGIWKCPDCGKVWTMTKVKFRFTKSCIYFWQEGNQNPISIASF
jgi:ribosomal protein L37AE/L43A